MSRNTLEVSVRCKDVKKFVPQVVPHCLHVFNEHMRWHMHHRMSCCAVTLRATFNIIIINLRYFAVYSVLLLLVFGYTLVALTDFFKPKPTFHLDLFLAKKAVHFNRLKMFFFIR